MELFGLALVIGSIIALVTELKDRDVRIRADIRTAVERSRSRIDH